jgi:hypothetical protein
VQVRCVLPPRHGRLRCEIITALRQPTAGQLEGSVAAQIIEVIGIRIAAGDGEDAGAQDVFQQVRDTRRLAVIGDHRGQCRTETKPSVGA